MVSTVTVMGWATHSDHLPWTSIQPRYAPQATQQEAVSARRPAITPISTASRDNEDLRHYDPFDPVKSTSGR